jgi:twitching motility protein PilT
MELEPLVRMALEQGASDLHLEAGMPSALRIRGALKIVGSPIPPAALLAAARSIIGSEQWPAFVERRSFDLSRTIAGARCRLNVMHTARGVGFAIRLLATFQASVERLNLHPEFKKLINHTHGLILVSGPTGCGKSSTMAGLIQEINLTEARHIVTIESPIEYAFKPRRSYIRQREVGRDTPSFEQALLDALREDPDVLMVGEMREAETMRLTLGASETGHLVLATVHSSSCIEAVQRVISAFPAEIQSSVASQLAGTLLAVVTQRLVFRPDLGIRVPECEVLMATHAVKNFIRTRDFFKIATCLETGAEHGMWTFARYRNWIEARKNWCRPDEASEPPDSDLPDVPTNVPEIHKERIDGMATKTSHAAPPASASLSRGSRIEIEPEEGEFGKILKRPGT